MGAIEPEPTGQKEEHRLPRALGRVSAEKRQLAGYASPGTSLRLFSQAGKEIVFFLQAQKPPTAALF